MRKNIVKSRALLNQTNQEQVPLDMTNKHSFYDKLTSYWNGKQNNDRKTDKRNAAKFISLEKLYTVLRNMNKYETPVYIKSRTRQENPILSNLFHVK
jgi:hypothetical protein